MNVIETGLTFLYQLVPLAIAGWIVTRDLSATIEMSLLGSLFLLAFRFAVTDMVRLFRRTRRPTKASATNAPPSS